MTEHRAHIINQGFSAFRNKTVGCGKLLCPQRDQGLRQSLGSVGRGRRAVFLSFLDTGAKVTLDPAISKPRMRG